MTKKNTHNLRLIKKDRGYIVPEIAALFGIHESTVRTWIKDGLKRIDNHRPHMVHSGDLRVYLKKKQSDRKAPCKPDQFYCMKCRTPEKVKDRAVTLEYFGFRKFQMRAHCETCNTVVYRAGSHKKLKQYEKNFVISTKVKPHLTEMKDNSLNPHLKGKKNDKKLPFKKCADQMELFPLSEGS